MFWHGKLKKHQLASIQSFINQDFDVWLWSIDPIPDLPKGVKNMDSTVLLPKSFLKHSYIHWSDTTIFHDSYPEEKSSAVFYSDYLRVLILKNYSGWWFDTDIFCLKHVSWFNNVSASSNFCAGYENKDSVNNAVLYINNQEYLDILINYIEKTVSNQSTYVWGLFGPHMYTWLVNKYNLKDCVLPIETFYPFVGDYFRPWSPVKEDIELCKKATKNTAALHWFDNVSGNKAEEYYNPDQHSFMDELFFTLK
jgi:hypothetical protein